MKILVTGGAGYIGSILIPMLLEQGHKVRLFDNFMWGVKPILHFASHSDFEIITGDVRDNVSVKKAMKGCDVIMHLAAIVGFPACAIDPDRAKSTNVQGTKNVASNLEKNQIMMFASTGSTYGHVEGICTEETPINPITLYGSTKSKAESIAIEAGAVALRFATVFGIAPRLRLDLLVNDFVYRALHEKEIIMYEGHFRRTFLHVKDAAESYLFTLKNIEQMKGKAFNVGDDRMNYKKRFVALKIMEYQEFFLHEADIGEDLDKRDYEVSYKKIKTLGYSTQVSLDEGIRELMKILKHIHVVNEYRNA